MHKTLIFAVGLLVTAVGLVLCGNSMIPEPSFHGELAKVLPPAPEGWTIVVKEIANTPEMKEAVGELLSYDDGVFVDYTNGTNRLSVYIAYWTPGKMSQRLVAGHTPDVCWVGNGWKKESSETVSGLTVNDGRLLPPAEGRLFTIEGRPEYVWFWHVVGPDVKSYAAGFTPPWYVSFIDLWEKGLLQRQEQFFIRLSSAVPLTDAGLSPALDAVLAHLPLPRSDEMRGY